MPQQIQTTLVEHKPRELSGRNGPWTLHVFKAADGSEYQTGQQGVANIAYGLLNQPAVITFEPEQRQGQNGQVYVNNKIQYIAPAGAQVAGAPVATAGAPLTAAAPAAPAPASSPGVSGDEREAVISRQAAQNTAIELVKAGIAPKPENYFEFLKLASGVLKANLQGFDVFAPAPAAAQADGAVIGATQGAPAEVSSVVAAPSAEAPTLSPGPDDGIPF